MHRKRRGGQRRSAAQWVEVFRRFGYSGQGVREFCQREGVALSTFQRWRQRLGSGAAAEFVELVPAMSPGTSSSAGWSVEVALPNGVQLRLRG